jgi:signal transduction histidine kinase
MDGGIWVLSLDSNLNVPVAIAFCALLMCQNQSMNENLRRLSTLINERQNQIIDRWKAAAVKLPRAQRLDEPLLLDHMPQMLHELSAALTDAQTGSILEIRAHHSAKEHGAIRFRLGFDVEEVIAEFGLLRDVIQEFAEACGVNISGELNRTVNRVIDKAIAVSLETYVQQQAEEVERKRQEYLSLWPIAERLKNDCQSIADSRRNTIRNDVPQDLQIYADPDFVREVLHNLLSNAMKYTTNGEIVIGGTENPDSTICWVKDTGIGLEPERIHRIFQRGTGHPNVAESTGLGLSIVRKVIRLHRGKISVESTPSAGTTFRVEFPKAQSKVA